MQGAIPVFTGYRKICDSHKIEIEKDKYQTECENCELRSVCINHRKPFALTNEDFLELVNKIAERKDYVAENKKDV